MVDASSLTPEQRKELEEKIKNMSPQELHEFQKQQCIFCQIIAGKTSSKKLYEDDNLISILDINPVAKGHILLMPKEHYAIMPQIPDAHIGKMFLVARELSQRLLKSLGLSGTNIFIANGLAAGQRAQHFMIHIIPRKEGDGLFGVTETLLDAKMLESVQTAIENKIFEVFGVKKVVQKTLEHTPEPEGEPEEGDEESEDAEPEEEDTEDEPEEEPDSEDEVDDEEEDADSDEEPEDETDEELEHDDESDEDEPDDESEEDPDDSDEDGGGANLDDISRLFQ